MPVADGLPRTVERSALRDAGDESPLRVLHCPANVAGNARGLAEAERLSGLASWAISFEQHRFGYPVDEYVPVGSGNPLASERRRWGLVRRALRDFDVVHFNFGRTLLPIRLPAEQLARRSSNPLVRLLYGAYTGLFESRDLAWLKRRGVGIAVTYQGDDARQGDWCRAHFDVSMAGEVDDGYYTDEGDRQKRRRIAAVDRYADRIYALNPDLLHVLPARAEFLPYASVDLGEWQPSGPVPGGNERPVVVHAPSHRGAKGTRYVLEAVERLKASGRVDFEFVLVENLPHAEARRLYERADLLIDQLLAGWYGALGLELMALGKPVICYLREGDLQFLPPGMRADLPLISADPSSIGDVLLEWLTVRRQELVDVGRRSRAFVEAWHDPKKIAARLAGDYRAMTASRG